MIIWSSLKNARAHVPGTGYALAILAVTLSYSQWLAFNRVFDCATQALTGRVAHLEFLALAYSRIKKLAQAQGIRIEFQPVNGSAISDDDVDDFAQHIEDLPKPVLAYCRSGTRCTVLWALSQAGKQPSDEILKTAAIAGYSLDTLRPRIAEREQDS